MLKNITTRCRWLLIMLLWPLCDAAMAAPQLAIEEFSITAGQNATMRIDLANAGTGVTLVQFDLRLPNGLTLAEEGGEYMVDMCGRTLWRNHSLQANKLADGSLRVLLSSATNTVIEGSDGALIALTLSAANNFTGGQITLNNILMVGPDETQYLQGSVSYTVTAKPMPQPGSATLSFPAITVGVGEEASLPINLNNANDEVTLVQFDMTLPTGLSLKKNGNDFALTMGNRTNAQSHTLQASQLGDGRIRVLLSSTTNTAISGTSGTIMHLTLAAAPDFAGGMLSLKDIIMVGPDEKVSSQDLVQQSVTVEQPVPVASISLSWPKSQLNVGETMQATATVLPADATNKTVKWISSDNAVATVSNNGLVTAVGPGTTTITVTTTDGTNLSDKKTLTVVRLASSVTLTLPKNQLNVGETMQATAIVLPDDATNKTVKWTSSNTAVATVSTSGLVTAVGTGSTTITATTTDGTNISDFKNLTVVQPVISVSVSLPKDELNVGETMQATCTVLPDNATNKTVKWESTNTTVATVNSNGWVTAVGAGTAAITVTTTDGTNLKDSKNLTVVIRATSVSLSLPKEVLNVGETMQATATVLPANATNKTVEWISSNTGVATVTSNGLVTAVGSGTTTISVKTTDGTELKDEASLTVVVLATGIEMSMQQELMVGKTTTATCTVTPANTTNKTVKWTSSAPTVASVNVSTGLIRALSPGTTTIRVETTDGSNISDEMLLTVVKKPEVIEQTTLGDVTYKLYTEQLFAEVIAVKGSNADKVIPESVSHEGVRYPVTAIADSVFCINGVNTDDLSCTIPATVTQVSDRAFDGVGIPAIIWNSSAPLSQRHISEIRKGNKNALIYVKNSDVLPNTDTDNIIVNGKTSKIVLQEQNKFHCPQQFTAEEVSFTHRFMMETKIGSAAGWETIVLPFDVATVSHETKGNITPFGANGAGDGDRHFWLYELTADGFVKATAMEAGRPYLIAMPNSEDYTEYFNLDGRVSFAATNVTVRTTTTADIAQQGRSHRGKTFLPSYSFQDARGDRFVINASTEYYSNADSRTPGSVFVSGEREVHPFEGFFWQEGAAGRPGSVMAIPFANGEMDGIRTMEIADRDSNNNRVFNLVGQTVVRGVSTLKCVSLPSGVYIVKGKKVMVRRW